jgi:hypothetical protein
MEIKYIFEFVVGFIILITLYYRFKGKKKGKGDQQKYKKSKLVRMGKRPRVGLWVYHETSTRGIEIDRKKGTIKKRSRFFYFKRVKLYSLSTFNTIKIIEPNVVSKLFGNIDSYRSSKWKWYQVQLYGPTSAARLYWEQDAFADDVLTILKTRDEEKAKSYACDLADFLGFPVFVVSASGFASTTEVPLDVE